jgi:hypothetical protein
VVEEDPGERLRIARRGVHPLIPSSLCRSAWAPTAAFDPTGGQQKRKPQRISLEVCQDEKGNRFVREATWKEVHSAEEAFRYLEQGQTHRATASTNLNAESSRSHSIFTLRVCNPRCEVPDAAVTDGDAWVQLVSAPISMRGGDIEREGITPAVTEVPGRFLQGAHHGQPHRTP